MMLAFHGILAAGALAAGRALECAERHDQQQGTVSLDFHGGSHYCSYRHFRNGEALNE